MSDEENETGFLLDKKTKAFVEDVLACDVEDARAAGTLGFFARILIQTTMPHSKPTANEFERRNGPLVLTMFAPAKVGIPYGTYPRLFMAYLTTQAVRTKSRHIDLGGSLSEFMRRLDLDVTGGKKGTVTVLRNQMLRLFSSAISWSWTGTHNEAALGGMMPIEHASLWWDVKSPTQGALWESYITLNEVFFKEITTSPVPVNMTALKVLARERSPMAFDIYSWLTYRMSYLKKDAHIPWELLQLQFGSDYTRTRAFKEKFLERLDLVRKIYRGVNVSEDTEGLILSPSPSHIPYKAIQGDWPFPNHPSPPPEDAVIIEPT